MISVVLYQPTIPPNTGTIGRQCAGMHVPLHIIEPIGFRMDDSALKRAGLDYWPHVDLTLHSNNNRFLEWLGDRNPWLVTKFGKKRYDEVLYEPNDVLIFGNELTGLPDAWHKRFSKRLIRIPMAETIRSYNLANSCSLVLAHAYSQTGLYDKLEALGSD